MIDLELGHLVNKESWTSIRTNACPPALSPADQGVVEQTPRTEYMPGDGLKRRMSGDGLSATALAQTRADAASNHLVPSEILW